MEEKLSIQDASRRLNISQRDVREYIRNGELKAERDPNSEHGRWLVVMPEDGWEDKFLITKQILLAHYTYQA